MHDQIFYHIYPLGLLGAPKTNPLTTKPSPRLNKLMPWLDYINALGCTALYLGPVFQSSTHGYDTIDYYQVDCRLGTDRSLRDLVSKAHKLGIKVILDGVFNHVGRDFYAFKDLQEHGKCSKYKNWFSKVNFSKSNPLGDSFSYDTWNGHYQLVKLNLKNTEVIDYLFGAVNQWITEYDIDGLRLDTADVLDFSFMTSLSNFCKERKTDFWLMGEVVSGNYNEWINEGMLDSITNYDYHTPFYESFNQVDFKKIAAILDKQYGTDGIYKKQTLYSFVDNHDVNRAASSLGRPEHLFPLYLLLFTVPGIPAIYYASEWGFEGKRVKHSDHLLRPKVELDELDRLAKHPKLFDAIRRFIAIRKNTMALSVGSYRQLLVKNEQFAFVREFKNQIIIVIINSSQKVAALDIAIGQLPQERYCDLLNPGFDCEPKKGILCLDIPSCWGRVLTAVRK